MENKIETVGELIDYLECFDKGTKILDDINPCWWSPRKPYTPEECPDEDIRMDSIIDAMCVATDLQLIDENKEDPLGDFQEYEHYNIQRNEEGMFGDNEYIIHDNNLIVEKTIVYISTHNRKLDNILANTVWGKIKRFMEKEPYVTLD